MLFRSAVHPNVKKVLVIGGGDGGVARELSHYEEIEVIDVVEPDEMFVEVCKEYFPDNSKGLDDERVNIYYQDGLRFLRTSHNEYDLIINDATDPFGHTEGLFTKEFYGSCYKALKDDGIMVYQHGSPFYDEDEGACKAMHKRVYNSFPISRVYQAHIPTCAAGYWLFGFASKKYHPLKDLDAKRWNKRGIKTKMVLEAVEKKNAAQSGEGFLVPIGVSARHIHLTQEHVEILFGEGYHLTKFKELMGGQFASNEKVTIVGLKLRAIENVRVLGPVRKNTQVEISATDAISLGVKAPIRESGNIAGSAPIAIIGPKGAVYLNEGCIVAKRHIHMAPKDAMAAGVHDGDIVSVKADNERGTIFNNVQIRVDDSFTLEMHIDTDEANAAQIKSGDTVRIVSC